MSQNNFQPELKGRERERDTLSQREERGKNYVWHMTTHTSHYVMRMEASLACVRLKVKYNKAREREKRIK